MPTAQTSCGHSCGLMMKEDKTQLIPEDNIYWAGCGLMMKEDKTQSSLPIRTL